MKILFKTIFIILLFNISINANSIKYFKYATKLIKNNKALTSKEIKELAILLKETQGTKKVGQVLSKMRLPNEVLEDTFMRLAIYTKRIERKEAEDMIEHLKNVPGFRTTLRKII
ncbi:MAG: hypothetical protein GXO60_09630 [Epsilonproteobacteria bacterium]|nr:hypothetical protein [Campylobacterota bacterium]